MAEGIANLPYYYDEGTGKLHKWEGRPALDGYITTDEIDCANAAATTIATITTGFKGYITFLSMTNTHTATQTLILVDGGGTKKTIYIGSQETVTWFGENPFMVLDAGVFSGQAGTADFIETSMTYFERKV